MHLGGLEGAKRLCGCGGGIVGGGGGNPVAAEKQAALTSLRLAFRV